MLRTILPGLFCCKSFCNYAGAVNKPFVKVSDAVRSALNNQKPVVALESTIITHGMPFPDNFRTAVEVENIVRTHGVVPATIAVLNGRIHIGMDDEKLHQLASANDSVKLSRRDLSAACAMGMNGGTTVSATMLIAHWCGIDVFVTGGIGGVHRMGQDTLDISADLKELGRTPMTVVSAGVKSILDIPRTLEFLEFIERLPSAVFFLTKETEGVTVATFGNTTDFPGFFTRKSGHHAPLCVSSVDEAASLVHTHKELKLNSGILLAVPIPDESTASGREIDQAIVEALDKCRQKNISGKAVTPYILQYVNETTGGKSLQANVALIRNNAEVGAKLARRLVELKDCRLKNSFKRKENPKHGRPVVVGGCIVDIVSRCLSPILGNEASNPAAISQTFGGVGRNIAESLWRLNSKPQMISVVGDDTYGEAMLRHLAAMEMTSISVDKAQTTPIYNVIFDDRGEVYVAVQDSDTSEGNADFVKAHEDDILRAPIVCLDANLSDEAIEHVCYLCWRHEIPLLFEPTGVLSAARAFQAAGKYREAIKFMTPNVEELRVIYESVTDSVYESRELDREAIVEMCRSLLPVVECILVTLGSEGVLSAIRQNGSHVFHHYPVDALPPWPWLSQPLANVSGSGDGFAAGFLCGILKRRSVHESIQIGLTVSQRNLRAIQAVSRDVSEEDAHHSLGAWKAARIA